MIVRKSGKISSDLNKLFGDLTNKLKKRIPGFQKTASRSVSIKSGTAYLYSYIRKSNGSVNTIVLVPAGKSSFTINTVAQGGANDAATQIGQMIVSFKAG